MKGRKSQKSLERRLKVYEEMKEAGLGGPKPTDKWMRRPNGQLDIYHKPGSQKK